MLASSPNRFILTTRYVSRAHRLLRDATARFEVIHLPPLSTAEVRDLLLSIDGGQTMLRDETGSEALARAVHALSDGRVGYAQSIGETLSRMVDAQGVGDPVSALTALLSPEGRLAATCAACYELRLHRARGYGALKAILEILAHEESLTLTEVAQRLNARRDLPRTTSRGSRTSTSSSPSASATASTIRCCGYGCASTAAPRFHRTKRWRARCKPTR